MPIPRPSSVSLAQAVGYFENGIQVPAHLLLRKLPDAVVQRFDGEPILLPRPHGAHPEVPMLILQDRNGASQLTISPLRIDVRQSPKESESLQLGTFFRQAAELISELSSSTDAQVNRLAAVAHRFSHVEDPARVLAEHFCQTQWLAGPLNRPATFELHAHKVFRTAFGIDVNSWVRNKSAQIIATGAPIVLVEQDMNTLVDGQASVFDKTGIASFFAGIVTEIDRALDLYYPGEQ